MGQHRRTKRQQITTSAAAEQRKKHPGRWLICIMDFLIAVARMLDDSRVVFFCGDHELRIMLAPPLRVVVFPLNSNPIFTGLHPVHSNDRATYRSCNRMPLWLCLAGIVLVRAHYLAYSAPSTIPDRCGDTCEIALSFRKKNQGSVTCSFVASGC